MGPWFRFRAGASLLMVVAGLAWADVPDSTSTSPEPTVARPFSLALNPWELAFQPLLRSLDQPHSSGELFERGGTHGDYPLVVQLVPAWHPPRSAWGVALPVYWRSKRDYDLRILFADARLQWYTPASNKRGYLMAGVRRTWESGRRQDDNRRVRFQRTGGFVGAGMEFSHGRFFASFAVMAGMYSGPEPTGIAGHNLQGSKVLAHWEPLLLGVRF